MNSDIRISLDFFRHPKTKKLKKRLGADGVFALQALWVFTAQSRTNGILEGMDKEDVELAADWYGEEGVFADTLLAIGFLDYSDGVYSIHDWQVHNSYAATEEERRDQSRFARLAAVNRAAYQELRSKGINAITSEQYKELTCIKRPRGNDMLTTPERPSNDRQTTVKATVNDALSPNQTKPNQTKKRIESVNYTDSCPVGFESAPDLQLETDLPADPDTEKQAEQDEAVQDLDESKLPESVLPQETGQNTRQKPKLDIPAVVSAYHEELPMLEKIRLNKAGEVISKHLVKALNARSRESPEFRNVESWRKLFAAIRDRMPFLTGKKTDFRATLLWISGSGNFEKILNGNYVSNGPNTGSRQSDSNLRVCQEFVERMRQKERHGGNMCIDIGRFS